MHPWSVFQSSSEDKQSLSEKLFELEDIAPPQLYRPYATYENIVQTVIKTLISMNHYSFKNNLVVSFPVVAHRHGYEVVYSPWFLLGSYI